MTADESDDARAEVSFQDEAPLPTLFGAYDRHLARLERELGVNLASRGGQVAITGPSDAVAAAETAINQLYAEAKSGGALMMTASQPSRAPPGLVRMMLKASQSTPISAQSALAQARKRAMSKPCVNRS